MGGNLQNLLYTVIAITVVLTVHEYSHAKIADMLGDPTPRNRGRLTLNPLSHLDPLGLLMLSLVKLGWAKPVPINPVYFRDRRKGVLYVSLAGPLSGIVLALIVRIVLGLNIVGIFGPAARLLRLIYIYSLIIAVFNLIPVYPLDGSRILESLLPGNKAFALRQKQGQIQMIFLLVVFLGNRFLWAILSPVIDMLDFVIRSITGT